MHVRPMKIYSCFLIFADGLCRTVMGESKLERFIQENPPSEENTKKARTQLLEARQDLQEALKREAKVWLCL